MQLNAVAKQVTNKMHRLNAMHSLVNGQNGLLVQNHADQMVHKIDQENAPLKENVLSLENQMKQETASTKLLVLCGQHGPIGKLVRKLAEKEHSQGIERVRSWAHVLEMPVKIKTAILLPVRYGVIGENGNRAHKHAVRERNCVTEHVQ